MKVKENTLYIINRKQSENLKFLSKYYPQLKDWTYGDFGRVRRDGSFGTDQTTQLWNWEGFNVEYATTMFEESDKYVLDKELVIPSLMSEIETLKQILFEKEEELAKVQKTLNDQDVKLNFTIESYQHGGADYTTSYGGKK